MKTWRDDASGPAALVSVAIHVAALAWALMPLARAPAPPVVRTISVTLLDAPVPVVATVAPPSPPRRARATARVAATPPATATATPRVRPADVPTREDPAPVALAATVTNASALAIAAATDTPPGAVHESAAAALTAPSAGLPGAAPAHTVVALLDHPLPDYPSMSRRMRETGRVLLDIVVGVDGRAQAVSVVESSGHERLDAAATAAVLRWRFEPARVSGQAVVAHVRVPVVFELGGGTRNGATFATAPS